MTTKRLTSLLAAALASCISVSVLAQHSPVTSQAFHTAARFSAGADVLQLQTAIAIAEPHARHNGFSWIRIYFYAFDLSAADVAGVSSGNIEGLERRRTQAARGGPDLNHSRAALHFLLDKNSRLSNASLEVPGLTCTIVVDAASAAKAVQIFETDGRQLRVKAKGTAVCDLTSVNGEKRSMSWDVDVNVPVFVKR
jgi:hypothetical protein